MTDLLKNNLPLLVEHERRWIRRFVGCIPTQAIEIGHRIIRVRHENNVGRQFGLLFQELLGVLIQIGRRSRIHEENSRVFCGKILGVVDEVMDLFHTVGALIAGESPQHNQHEGMSLQVGRHLYSLAGGRRERKVWRLGSNGRGLAE